MKAGCIPSSEVDSGVDQRELDSEATARVDGEGAAGGRILGVEVVP